MLCYSVFTAAWNSYLGLHCVLGFVHKTKLFYLGISREVRAIKYRASATFAKAVTVNARVDEKVESLKNEYIPMVEDLLKVSAEEIHKANASGNLVIFYFDLILSCVMCVQYIWL